MSAFEDLKKRAQTTLTADEAKAKSWFVGHKTTIIACAACLVAGFILAKAFA
jgi:hypothetical protein